MARDPQAALVALNRFGFGARGGASGDFVNAASDPRGFVKAELARPATALLEAPGLQTTPDLAAALFAYQLEVKEQREAAAKAAAASAESKPKNEPPPPAMERPEASAMAPNGATMNPAGTMKPAKTIAAKPQLNIIQKTYRAEALARIQRATLADCGIVERLVAFWSNHFCISASKGQPARIWAGAWYSTMSAARPTAACFRRSSPTCPSPAT